MNNRPKYTTFMEFLTPSCYNYLILHGLLKYSSNQRKMVWRWRTQTAQKIRKSVSRKAGGELKSKET